MFRYGSKLCYINVGWCARQNSSLYAGVLEKQTDYYPSKINSLRIRETFHINTRAYCPTKKLGCTTKAYMLRDTP